MRLVAHIQRLRGAAYLPNRYTKPLYAIGRMTFTNKIFIEYLEEVAAKVNGTDFNTPAQRRLHKTGYSFSDFSVESQIQIWNYIWKPESIFWIRIQAFFYCESLLERNDDHIKIWPTIREWQDKVYSWGLCDCLSKIYSKILEINPNLVLPTLSEWNKSENLWKRRQSIVSLIYYSSVRNSFLPFDEIISRVHNLIQDSEYYVQKGVGWTLRELFRAYPEETLKYLDNHATDITSIAFTAVSSALDKKDKERLKQRRKKH